MMAAFLVITASIAILTPMAQALRTSSADEVWVASIYSMVVSCLVLTAATVGDVIGRRLVFAAGVFVLVLVPFFIPDSRSPGRRLDPAGLVLGVLAIGALSYGVIRGGNAGFATTETLASFCVAALSAVAFVVVERNSSAPMLHLHLFANPSFSAANAAAFVAQFSFVGIAFAEVLYFEQVKRYSVLELGIRLLALTGTYVITGAVAPHVVSWLGFKIVITGGLVLLSAGGFLLLAQGPSTSPTAISLVLALCAVGVGLVLPPATAVAVVSVEDHQGGMASGAVNMSRQVGSALGAAILGTVLTSGLAANLPGALTSRGVPAATSGQIAATVT